MGGLTVIIMQVSVQIGLNWYWTEIELGKRPASGSPQTGYYEIARLWATSPEIG